MGLFDLFKKKQQQPAQNVKPNIVGMHSDRLDSNGELPWGWIAANKVFVDQINGRHKYFLDAWLGVKGKDVLKEYAALKSFVTFLNEAKERCVKNGECHAKWFSDIIASQKLIDKYTSDLKYIEANIDDLLKAEKRKKEIEQNVLPHLKADLVAIIKNEPGVMQSDIYKRFDADIKPHISSVLFAMDKAGLIRREKSGKSYKLTMV